MTATRLDVEALTRIIGRLEAELRTNPPPSRQTALQQQLDDARHLRTFVAKEADVATEGDP